MLRHAQHERTSSLSLREFNIVELTQLGFLYRTNTSVIGVDMGGTTIHAGRIHKNRVVDQVTTPVSAQSDMETVLQELSRTIEEVFDSDCAGIGLGVPSVVDRTRGIVYDVEHIPSWKEVPLREILEQRFQVPISLNNDANCFALIERYSLY